MAHYAEALRLTEEGIRHDEKIAKFKSDDPTAVIGNWMR